MFDFLVRKSVRQASKILKQSATLFLVAATLLWSVGSPLGLLSALPAFAASTVLVTNGTVNEHFPGAFIPANSPPIAIAKVRVTASAADKTLTSIQVNFSGSGFATTDLEALATGGTSGVALSNDAGSIAGSFDESDEVILLADSPAFSGTNIILTPATPVALTNGSPVVFYIIIQTSADISNNDIIDATIPTNGVVTSDGSGPASPFVINNLRADTAPATIQSVAGFVGSATVTVKFSKPVQKVGGGNLAAGDSPFTYVDGGGSVQTISAISHMAGQDVATLTMSSVLDTGDVDGSPATLAAGTNKIADMAGNVLATTPANIGSPLGISTANVPLATVAAAYTSDTPLVTFSAVGGVSPYSFTANSAGDSTILSNLGLSLATNGKLTGTVANTPGTYQVNVKVTDSTGGTPLFSTRLYNINVATSGGSVPAVTAVNPPGGAQSAVSLSVTLSGSNTSFSGSSSVQFLFPPGASGTNGITVGAVTANSGTSLSFPVTIAADATTGPRDIQVITGSQTVTMPNGFSVFAAGASGLTLLLPADASTGNPVPPSFQFNPSSNVGVNSYKVTVATTADFSTKAWEYVFPKPADGENSNGSHCGATNCIVNYGSGSFHILQQPTALSPDTVYYWKVSTFSEAVSALTNSAVPLETTVYRSFRTTASVLDAAAPNIMHRPVFNATASTNLVMFARVVDDKTTTSTTPALSTNLFHCQGADCTPTTEVAGVSVGAGYFSYTIPGGSIGASGTITRYFLRATDGTNTANFKKQDATPFQLTASPSGSSGEITGTVKDSTDTCASAVQSARVFIEGTGFNTTTNGSCAFTLSGLPTGTFDLVAIKDGYGDRLITGIPAGATAIPFKLTSGAGGGTGGDTTKPRIKFTGPMDGMTNMPGGDTNFKIMAVFDKSMSQSSITTTGNMTVNEVNLATGGLTNITATKGAWTYFNTAPSVMGLPPEANMAVWSFTGGQTFGDNKTIAVVISSGVTDTAGNSIHGNQSDGSYVFSFTTSSTASFSGNTLVGGTFGSGAFVAPRVNGVMPAPGSVDVPRNRKVVIDFSVPMADDGGGYTLASAIKLFTVSGTTETDITSSAIEAVTLNSVKTSATVTLKSAFNSGLFAATTNYRLKVMGTAKASSGMTLAPPQNASTTTAFVGDFKTSIASDTSAPTVAGTFPDTDATSVPVNVGAISVGFSKDMDASTITSNNVYLSIGSTVVNGTLEYRPLERQAFFLPKGALSPMTTYTLNISTDVEAANGVALASAVTRSFTTALSDSAAPSISFMNADDYSIAVTFSEPMNSAKATDTLNWSTSVVNPAVYNVLKYGAVGFDASAAGTVIPLSSAHFKYDPVTNTVIISGLSLSAAIGQELYLSMDVTGAPASGAQIALDVSGNAITSAGNSSRATLQNSAITKGALGPMASSADLVTTAGQFIPTHFSSDTFGFVPSVEVRPFNTGAGKTTIYGARIPVSKQITSGGTVTLTFPSGFDVSGAKQDVNSPKRTDLNGPGSGTITFKCVADGAPTGASCAGTANTDDTGAAQGGLAGDGVVVNTSARSVTIYLSAATNVSGNDFFEFDIAGIKNSTVPKDPTTAGYTVDIKTKNSTTVLESLTSAPFYIQESGSFSLTGTVTATGNDQSGTMNVYLMSPMTGPAVATTTDFAGGATATYSFTGLAAGEYMLMTDQTITLASLEYAGKPMPERISISGNTTKNFTLSSNTSGGINVTISIDGPSNEPLDIFAMSQTNFKVKQVTLDSSAGAEIFTINLPAGKWQVGVGPQMPKGGTGGVPPTPAYLPPRPIEIAVAAGPAFVENSGTANDGTLVFALTNSTKTIRGLVQDAAGLVMANAEVFAYSPTGGMGTHTQADLTGAFTLNVVDGTYIVGAFIPGMPPSKDVPVTVTSDETTYLLINGSTTAITPATAASSFILKVAKPDYTIAGKVTDGTNAIQGASVYAYRTDAPGHANAQTDSSGKYTLYVSAGTWKVGSFLPQYGQLTELDVVITTASASDKNFSPSQTGIFYSVSGTVTSNGAAVQGAFVRISGNGTFNEAISGSDGTYSVKVPAGNGYVVRAFVPGVGDAPALAAFNVSADVTGKNITIGTLRTVTFTLSEAANVAIEAFSSTGQGNRIQINNTTSGTMSLPDGSYKLRANMKGLDLGLTDMAGTGGTIYSTTTGVLTVDSAEAITVTLPTRRTVTGTVTDGSGPVADAWVEISNTTAGVHFGTKSGADGTFTLKVADSETSYRLNAMKPGYFREPSSLSVNGSNPDAQTVTLTSATTTIAGQILVGGVGVANAFVRAEKQGGGFSGTQADANGNYSLSVTSGVWKVYAVGHGYAEAEFTTNPIDVTAGSVTGKNITLATTVALDPIKSKSITPASGGTLEDAVSGVTITAPANAFGSDTSAASLTTSKTNNVRQTDTARPVAGRGIEIDATDSSGNAITTLNDNVVVEITYTREELAATASATDASINTSTEVNKLKMASFDETTANWVTKESTVTCKDDAGVVITDATTIDTAEEFAAEVATCTIAALTNHFSLYAPVVSTSSETLSAPSGLSATGESASRINLSWSAVSGATGYDIYRSTSSNGTFTRVGSEPTVSSGSTTSYADTSVPTAGTYYYKITTLNDAGESAATSAVSAVAATASSGGGGGSAGGPVVLPSTTTVVTPTTTTTTTPTVTTSPTPSATAAPSAQAAPVAVVIHDPSKFEALLAALGTTSKPSEYAKYKAFVKSDALAFKVALTDAQQMAIANFVTYGASTSTVKLGAGERRAVIRDYMETVGRSDVIWEDVERMATGQKIVHRNLKNEQAQVNRVLANFRLMTGKQTPDFKNPAEDIAWNTMMYRIRFPRDLVVERKGIVKFKALYKRDPSTPMEWSIVRALGYALK